MNKLSIKIFSLGNTGVYINLIFAGLFFIFPPSYVVSIFFAILVHEISHVLVAKKCGYDSEKIIISLLGGAALINSEWVNDDKSAIKIAFAGPLSNAALFLISFLLGIFYGKYFIIFAFINLVIAVFNLIPVYPMDGGVIFYHILNRENNKKSKIVSIISSVLISIFIILFGIKTGNYISVSFFVFFALVNVSRAFE